MVNPQLQSVTEGLVGGTRAKVAFILDKGGNLLAASGDVDRLDSTAVASVIAGDAARQAAAAQLKETGELFVRAEVTNLYIRLVGNRILLMVYFDQESTLGLVRFHAGKAGELVPMLDTLAQFNGSDIVSLLRG